MEMTLGFLSGSKNFCKLLCVSWEHAYEWIHSVAKVLHHDCISMIVSRFTTFTENFVICCCQITKKKNCTKTGSAIASSARGPRNFGPLTDLAISVFREMSMNIMLTQILTSRRRGLYRYFMRKTGVWVSAFRNFIIHKIFSKFFQPFRYVGKIKVSPFLLVVFVYIWFWIFWLAWSTCLPVLFVQHVNVTQILDRNLSHTSLLLSRVSLSVDTVVVGEDDELEEVVGWWLSCLEGDIEVGGWEH